MKPTSDAAHLIDLPTSLWLGCSDTEQRRTMLLEDLLIADPHDLVGIDGSLSLYFQDCYIGQLRIATNDDAIFFGLSSFDDLPVYSTSMSLDEWDAFDPYDWLVDCLAKLQNVLRPTVTKQDDTNAQTTPTLPTHLAAIVALDIEQVRNSNKMGEDEQDSFHEMWAEDFPESTVKN